MELEFARLQKLNELQAAIGYKFKDTELLNTALTHTSYVKGDGNGSVHNERLEFLGDAVLELCVSEKLYKEYPELNEGVMTRVRSLSVCEGALHKSAVGFGLGNYLLLSHGEEHSGGRSKPSILADAMEAVIGAVFLDGGICRHNHPAWRDAIASHIPPDVPAALSLASRPVIWGAAAEAMRRDGWTPDTIRHAGSVFLADPHISG